MLESGEMLGEGWVKVIKEYTSSYNINKFQGFNVQHGDYGLNIAALDT